MTPIVSATEARREVEGETRVPLLPLAYALAWAPPAPSTDEADEEPLYVWIEWAPDLMERPYPGSALWRAALERIAARVPAASPLVEDALRRFPTLESWLRWQDHDRRPSREPSPSARAARFPGVPLWWPW